MLVREGRHGFAEILNWRRLFLALGIIVVVAALTFTAYYFVVLKKRV